MWHAAIGEARRGETALSPEVVGAARRQPPKQRCFCWETQRLPAANALIVIKHLNAKSAKSWLTINVQSYAQLLSSRYLLSSPSKATFVGGYPLISIIGHTRRDTSRSYEETRSLNLNVSRSDLVQHICVNISSFVMTGPATGPGSIMSPLIKKEITFFSAREIWVFEMISVFKPWKKHITGFNCGMEVRRFIIVQNLFKYFLGFLLSSFI